MKLNATFVLTLLAPAAVAVPAVIALQAPADAAGCGIFANKPYANAAYTVVRGSGGRSGCTNNKQIKIDLRWDRPFSPDPSIGYKSGTYKNVTLTAEGDCLAGTHDYYVEVSGDAGHTSGSRANISANDDC
ncbi:hypothetical protein [Nocardioides plantarum]|uniref:hypothetical protein n=1 Tax=Nocardioides plantarum TaxID=29299 RepID=UPI00111EF393|nr:hypothetical protein [Nocardioides plantarum]